MKCSQFGWALACLFQLVSAAPPQPMPAKEQAPIGYATMKGGTTGGIGGPAITVTTLSQLRAAVAGDSPAIVYISGIIKGNTIVEIGSNKSVLGKNSGAGLEGIGLCVLKQNNVIIRNLKISKVRASTGGDAISLVYSDHVWIDHLDLSSEMSHGKDYYDGLLDITHECDWITVSHCKFHDHWKASLVGHTDSNGYQDKGHLTVTYSNNHFVNVNSRVPSVRFGSVHIYNNLFDTVTDGINTRDGAELLIENNVFKNVRKPIFSFSDGCATATGNDFDGKKVTFPAGNLHVPYKYDLVNTTKVASMVAGNCGNILSM